MHAGETVHIPKEGTARLIRPAATNETRPDQEYWIVRFIEEPDTTYARWVTLEAVQT